VIRPVLVLYTLNLPYCGAGAREVKEYWFLGRHEGGIAI
jgi:hypothetical protein